MGTALQLPQPFPRRKLLTRLECTQLASVVELSRYELIEGDLVEKVSKNHPHSRCLLLLVEWLRDVFGKRVVVQEPSIDVAPEDNPTSEPEPDLVVLTRSFLDLVPRPRPEDIALVVEISDSTLGFTVKRDLYARAAIAEYWVVDVNARRIVVHRDPGAGRYGSISTFTEDDRIAPLAALDQTALVRDLI